MSDRIERWALIALMVTSPILVIASIQDGSWFRVAAYTLVLVVVTSALVRQRRRAKSAG